MADQLLELLSDPVSQGILQWIGRAGLLLRTGGPNDWVNLAYSSIAINIYECGKTKSNRRICDNQRQAVWMSSTRICRQIFCL